MTEIKKQKHIEECMMFSAGAVVYTAAELLWRGHTHWTMTVTGGICALLIHLANRAMKDRPLSLRCLAGSGIITGMEFAVGCLVNCLLDWSVWDYSSMPFNIMGQICPLYSAMWFFISFPAIALSTWLELSRRKKTVIELGFDRNA